MIVIPAIDLKDGRCVRLKQGLMEKATVFTGSPRVTARRWLDAGARRLHLVDLNGAFAGAPVNLESIKEIIAEVAGEIPLQLGGGIRNLTAIATYLDLGLDFIIIGTAALTHPQLVQEAAALFPGKIMVGIDAKDGLVATEGWAKVSDVKAVDLARRFEDAGVAGIIYTDISRDGMLSGVNIKATLELARAVSIPVIASGGVTNLTDIERLAQVSSAGITGVITGRAIYEGTLDFHAAEELAIRLTA